MTDKRIEYLQTVDWRHTRTVAIEILPTSNDALEDPMLLLFEVIEFENNLPTNLHVISKFEVRTKDKIKYVCIISDRKRSGWILEHLGE